MPILTPYQEKLRKNDKVQSLVFDKDIYNIDDICKIAKFLNYTCFDIHETKNKFRVRQFNPGLNNNPGYYMRNSRHFPGLELVIEYENNR
jgi:hypothetical protein